MVRVWLVAVAGAKLMCDLDPPVHPASSAGL
jgi:hypothetical protein